MAAIDLMALARTEGFRRKVEFALQATVATLWPFLARAWAARTP